MTHATATLDARCCDPNTDEGGRRETDENLGAKHRAAPRQWLYSRVSVQLERLLIKEEVQRAPLCSR
jgi:hypothetical protein